MYVQLNLTPLLDRESRQVRTRAIDENYDFNQGRLYTN